MGEFAFSEMIVVAILAIVIYGKDLPQVARKLASLYAKLRRQLTDMKDELHRQIPAEEMKVDLNLPTGTGEPPSTPSGLTASMSGDRALLTWNSSLGAMTYTIKRSSGEGMPHYVLASGLAELSYYDSDVQGGMAYSYVISASNSYGESSDSESVPLERPTESAPSPDAASPAPDAAAGSPAPAISPAPEIAVAPPPPAAEPPPAPSAESPAGGNGHSPAPTEVAKDPAAP